MSNWDHLFTSKSSHWVVGRDYNKDVGGIVSPKQRQGRIPASGWEYSPGVWDNWTTDPQLTVTGEWTAGEAWMSQNHALIQMKLHLVHELLTGDIYKVYTVDVVLQDRQACCHLSLSWYVPWTQIGQIGPQGWEVSYKSLLNVGGARCSILRY